LQARIPGEHAIPLGAVTSRSLCLALVIGGCASPTATTLIPRDHLPDIADAHAGIEARNVTHPCSTTQTVMYATLVDRTSLATYVYDRDGRAMQDVVTDNTQLFEQVNYTWDGEGQLTHRDDLVLPTYNGVWGDPSNITTEFVETLRYDSLGDLVSDDTIDEWAVEIDSPAAATTFAYSGFDELGHPAHADEVQSVPVANNDEIPAATIHTVHAYTYDDLGRRTGVAIVDDTGATAYSSTTVYDDAARTVTMTALTAGVGTTVMTESFNDQFNLVAWTLAAFDDAGNPVAQTPASSGTQRFAGDRMVASTATTAAADERVAAAVAYGCTVDQNAQENLYNPRPDIATLPRAPFDPPVPPN
jgi:hypothetical protein